jgi:hypothetical protein
MKKIFLLLICFFSLLIGLKAQTNTETSKWFVSFSTGFCIGSPNNSINNTITDQNFNMTSNSWFGSVNYPVSTIKQPLLFMLGKRITKYGSLYLLVGQPTGGKVDGYNGVSFVTFDYNVLQFTLGYQFTFPKTRFKVGVGPSLFIFNNSPQVDYHTASSESSSIPGATVNVRVPFGQEKKLFGVELFFQMNLAPGAKLGEIQNIGRTLPASNVSMTHAIIGITFAFRG